MRSLVCMNIMVFILALSAPAFAADAKLSAHPKDSVEFTGQMWLNSSEAEKLAFLLGVEMTIATEQYLSNKVDDANKSAKREKKLRASRPSVFAKGWLRELGDTTRPQLVAKLDDYIMKNPEARELHVFRIIWEGFIEPGLEKARAEQRGTKS